MPSTAAISRVSRSRDRLRRVREYVPGDEVRAIDWNVTARAGPRSSRISRRARADVDASRRHERVRLVRARASRKREHAAELACVLALSAVQQRPGRPHSVFRSDRAFRAAREGASARVSPGARSLAFEPKGRGTELAWALRLVRERLSRRAVVVILSDFLIGQSGVDESRPELRALGQRHDVVAIRLGDRLDRQLPSVGLLTLEDAETGEVVEVDTGSASNRARLGASRATRTRRIRSLARSARVDCSRSTRSAHISARSSGSSVPVEDERIRRRHSRHPTADPHLVLGHWIEIAVLAGLVVAALTFGLRRWRRQSARPLTPEEQARRALASAESLAREGRTREWAEVVARTLRTALSARLGLDAGPQTTSELASEGWVPQPHQAEWTPRACSTCCRPAILRVLRMGRLDAAPSSRRPKTRGNGSHRLFAVPSSLPPRVASQGTP